MCAIAGNPAWQTESECLHRIIQWALPAPKITEQLASTAILGAIHSPVVTDCVSLYMSPVSRHRIVSPLSQRQLYEEMAQPSLSATSGNSPRPDLCH